MDEWLAHIHLSLPPSPPPSPGLTTSSHWVSVSPPLLGVRERWGRGWGSSHRRELPSGRPGKREASNWSSVVSYRSVNVHQLHIVRMQPRFLGIPVSRIPPFIVQAYCLGIKVTYNLCIYTYKMLKTASCYCCNSIPSLLLTSHNKLYVIYKPMFGEVARAQLRAN